ncbi:hypothetical protein BG004_002093 [Podila humilis]|nr:hypothetical protein BG004_002093 [Podila humilis]
MNTVSPLNHFSAEFEYLTSAQTSSPMTTYQPDGTWPYTMSLSTYDADMTVISDPHSSAEDIEDKTNPSSFPEGVALQTMNPMTQSDPSLLSAFPRGSYQDHSFEYSPSPSPSPIPCLTPSQTINSSEFLIMMNEAASRLNAMAAETSPVTCPVDIPYDSLARLQLNQQQHNPYPSLFSLPRDASMDIYLSPAPSSASVFGMGSTTPFDTTYGLPAGFSVPTLMACDPATLLEQQYGHASSVPIHSLHHSRQASSLSSSLSSSTLVDDSPSSSPPRQAFLTPSRRYSLSNNRESFSAGQNKHSTNGARVKRPKPRYVCLIPGCGRSFSRPFNLKSHALTHEPQRPHACDQCPKTFARIHDRDRHMKGHLTVKAHSCVVCLGRFARQDAVTRHLKLANEMNPCSLILKANGVSFRDAAAGRVTREQLGEDADIRKTLDMLDEQARRSKASRGIEMDVF